MAKAISQSWGETLVEFQGIAKEPGTGRMLLSYGVNTIRAGEMVPLHLHTDCCEDYNPLEEGLIILVIPEKEYKDIKGCDVLRMLESTKPAEVGKPVKCPKGYAHMAYNTDTDIIRFKFVKYNED